MPFTAKADAAFYTDFRLQIIGNEGFRPTVYQPGDHVPTIGYGYTFVRRGAGNRWGIYEGLAADLAAIGRPLTAGQLASVKTIVADLNAGALTAADTLIAQLSSQFGAITSADADTLFKREVDKQGEYLRARMRNVLGATDGNALYLSLDNSEEKRALLDVAYFRGAGNISAELIVALQNEDRAEAWFQLRYRSAPSSPQAGHIARLYRDADLFGLYDSPGIATSAEAVQVYRMLTLRRGDIESYEAANPPLVTLNVLLAQARDRFVADLESEYAGLAATSISSIAATDIYLDPGRATVGSGQAPTPIDEEHSGQLDSRHFSSSQIEQASNDLLVGEGGGDILIAGLGDDILVGGQGGDTLNGGMGNDVYVFRSGDGLDTVVGNDDDGSILFDGIVLSGAGAKTWINPLHTERPAWSWQSNGRTFYYTLIDGFLDPEGTLTGTLWIQSDSIVYNDRIAIEEFRPGDLGLELPVDQQPTLIPYASTQNPFSDPLFQPSVQTTSLVEGHAQSVTLALNMPARDGQSARIAVSELGESLSIVTGAEIKRLDNGFIEIELSEGQTQLTFSLLSAGDVDASTTFALTATLLDAQSGPIGAVSTLNVNFVAREEAIGEPVTTNIIDPAVPGSVQGAQLDHAADYYGTAQNDLIYTRSSVIGGGSRIALDEYGGDDAFVGGDGANQVFAGSGNDWISGGAYIDFLYGDLPWSTTVSGNDVIEGGAGSDLIEGQGGDDQLWASSRGDLSTAVPTAESEASLTQRGDILLGGAGRDSVIGSSGSDILSGGDGEDVLIGGGGDDLLLGDQSYAVTYTIPITMIDLGEFDWGWTIDRSQSTQPDGSTLYSVGVSNGSPYTTISVVAESPTAGGADSIHGGQGNDTIFAGVGDDFVSGGTGNDLVFGGGGGDTILGDEGDDILIGGGSDDIDGADFVDGGNGNDQVEGGNGADTLYGGAGDDVLKGDGSSASLGGSDYLNGELGNDQLFGGSRADVLIGGDGDDALYGDTVAELAGNDSLDGGAGADLLVGAGGDDTLSGGSGNDQLFGDSSDTPSASQGDDFLDGGAGDDVLVGGGGSDTLLGGTGADELHGDGGTQQGSDEQADHLDGGAGDDILTGDGGDDVLLGGEGDDHLFGDNSTTAAEVLGDDYLSGGEGNDFLTGNGGNDVLRGDGGNDALWGDEGDDDLDGGDGNDTIQGGAGDDLIRGGAGADTLMGGAGDDTYLFEASDLLVSNGVADGIIDTEGTNRVVIRGGLTLDALTLSAGSQAGSLVLSQPGTSLGLVIRDALSGSIDSFEFADGTVVSSSQLIGSKFNGYANAASSVAGAHLVGGLRADTLSATGAGAVIAGGAGNDLLTGGAGSTTYVFERGGGIDTITDASTFDASSGVNVNVLELEEGIASQDVSLRLTAGSTALSLDLGSGDAINMTAPVTVTSLTGARTIDEVRFADGSTQTWQQFVSDKRVIIANTNNVASYSGSEIGDDITGSTAAENISAGAGDDTIDARGGNDTIEGGAGSDTYLFGLGYGNDVINNSDTAAGKIDRLQIAGNIATGDVDLYRLADDLLLFVRSTAESVRVTNYFTTAGLDEIAFADGTVWTLADVTPVAIVAVQDTFTGTSGNDTFVVDNPFDVVVEGIGAGNDTILSSVSYLLPNNVENLTLTGAANLNATGNTLDNVLTGNAGNNILDGRGGQDTMAGGAGNDSYLVDNANDVIVENANEGTDGVQSSVSYALTGNIENLTLTGTQTINATGNALNNVLTGNDADNRLDGGGGADTMIGGQGDDVYVVDNVGDTVIDTGTGYGNKDRIESYVSIVAPEAIEEITLLGTAAISATAYASWADNVLDGSLNSAANTLVGGDGQDTYIVDGSDIVVETQYGGVEDRVYIVSGNASSYSTANYANVERLFAGEALGDVTLISDSVATEYIMLTGNAGSNTFIGGDGNDLMRAGRTTNPYGTDPSPGEYDQTYGFGRDVFIGGHGFDSIIGGRNTTIRFARGDGQDDITLYGDRNGSLSDRIEFTDATITAADVVLSQNTYQNLTISLAGTSDSMSIWGQFAGVSGAYNYSIEEIVFVDGTIWSVDDIANRTDHSSNVATAGSDVIGGTQAGDTIDGLGGSDNISGGAGDDVLIGSAGNDKLFGNAGSDSLSGGADQDDLRGGDGADTLTGGIGNDSLRGGAGSDVYRFAAGDGQDVIIEDIETSNNTDTDVLELAAGVQPSDVVVFRTSNDLVIKLAGLADRVTVSNFFSSGSDRAQIETVRFANGTEWSAATLTSMGNATSGTEDADTLSGTSGEDYLNGLGGNDSISGGDGNDTLDGGAGDDVMAGQAGDDTYIVDSVADSVLEDANQGVDLVLSSVSWTLGANVENLTLTGSASTTGTGNSFANTITGNAGANTIDGGAGADSLIGGNGDDTYVVDNSLDMVTEASGAGLDTVRSSVTYSLSANVENLVLTGSGAIDGTGNVQYNELSGNSGSNTLNGGVGADRMSGGVGDDTYVVDNVGDVIVENTSEGIDQILSSLAYTLGSNVENLVLTGTSAIDGTGNGLSNVITGNSTNNLLNGGTGADQLIGGLGNDTYVVDDAGDAVVEAASEGTDTVQASISYTLAGNVENLTLLAGSAINGMGNSLANNIVGNASDNILDGGAGVDSLSGGAGNDTYLVDSTQDTITEGSGAGTDTVIASVTYSLATLSNVENLTLAGAASIAATGNSLANTLTGNSAANVLDGGFGADTLRGGAGDDVYVVDNASDVVVELAGEGADLVQSSVSYTLAGDVENLTLTGTSSINATGNAMNNALVGNSGNNTLDGGAGADAMSGGAGNDTYIVDNAGDAVSEAAAAGADTVRASISFTIGSEVENLVLTGASSINATGNALANVITGNSGDNILDGGAGVDTLDGGIGNDTYLADDLDVISEAYSAGTDTIVSAFTRVLGSNIENLTLTGTSAVNATGNDLANLLTGNSADNVLDGSYGADSMAGGAGNDTYIVDDEGDAIVEASAAGTDLVLSSVSFTLAANVENLTLTSYAADGHGNASANILTGNEAQNLLDGGAGADQLIGAGGGDTYVVDNAGDVVIENVDEGFDFVQSSISYTLGANIESLTLTGTAAISGIGNALDNTIIGNDGDNTLNGGAGMDSLSGGLGNDIYVVDTIGDTATEYAGGGIDLVQASLSWTLGTELENLTLTGSSAIDGTGNELNNALAGNVAANTLDGGLGADTLAGGAGDDSYVIDDAGDIVVENTSEGTDLIRSYVSRVLEANVERLTLEGYAAIDATGNSLNNVLTGNAADNVINGGAGADSMIGGYGNDTYVVDNALDSIVENAYEGVDQVQSSLTFVLGYELEELVLTGTNTINGTGNAAVNTLTGNVAANTLNGLEGADTLIGRGGNDIYVVDDAGDVVIEASGEGTDLVQASTTYALSANVENLTLTGTASIGATGNELGNTITGNGGDNTIDGGGGTDTLIGGAGNDTYVVDSTGDVVTEGTNAGVDTIQSSVSYTLSLNVENLILTGVDAINATGNTLANSLTGNAGNNTLNGGTGADTMMGGSGDDIYIVDNAGDVVTENYYDGIDLVQSSLTYTLTAEVENLTLTGTAAINGTGNYLENVITGNAGINVLNGGAGADRLIGGLGNDTYVVDDANDVIVENASEGTDVVQTSVNYMLADNVENLVLLAGYSINGTGNALVNTITGNALDNILDGGAGSDTLIGGAGNDTYLVDSTAEIVTEGANAGTDTVIATASYTLAGNVENLTLAGEAATNATGNTLANVLIGNSANNVLSGGTGADTMSGAAGDDTYVVDNVLDTIYENGGEGTDSVQSSVTHTLAGEVENLTLTGTAAINATGNWLSNTLVGNTGANTLDGAGGADTMAGGAGNDIYVVDDVGDLVTEAPASGTDLVRSSVSYTLGDNVENLTLLDWGSINGIGNALVNILTGNSSDNVLDGGAGIDTMIGGAGNDTYIADDADVVTEAADAGIDTIMSAISRTLGTNIENLTLTGTSAINATGNTLANVLVGNIANNTLNGGTGADSMLGGAGDDIYVVDNVSDSVTEYAAEGTDLVQSSVSYSLTENIENLTLTGSSGISASGNESNNVLLGNSGANAMWGYGGNDTLNGGAGSDSMTGGLGDDTYWVDAAGDTTNEYADEGIDTVNASVTHTLAANVDILFQTGTTAINGTGNALSNLLRGNVANNVLAGGGGFDFLEGGAGSDTLTNATGASVMNGGADVDTLTASSGNDLLIGGTGNDTLTTGTGADIIAFNVGDGQDTVNASTTRDNTVSLGGARYADLLFQKVGNNLVLQVGASDQITFVNYYSSTANHSVNSLQVVLEGTTDYVSGSSDQLRDNKIETFDFEGLVTAFDAARASDPGLTSWALTNALVSQHVSGSDTAALGGDLAYRYNRFGSLADISFVPGVGMLNSTDFGVSAQSLQALASLQDSSARLN